MVFINNIIQQITHGGCRDIILDTGIDDTIEVIGDCGVE